MTAGEPDFEPDKPPETAEVSSAAKAESVNPGAATPGLKDLLS